MFLRWFSRYERTNSQVADRDRRLLVVTLHVAVAGPEDRRETQLKCLAHVWPLRSTQMRLAMIQLLG